MENFKKYMTPSIMLILALIIISIFVIMPVLNMVILGAILAYAIKPLVNKVQKKLKYPSISILFSIIVVIIPLVLLLAYIILVVSGVIVDFLNLNANSLNLATISNYIPQKYSQSIYDSLISVLKDLGSWILSYLVDLAKKVPDIIVQLFVLLSSIYYFVKDGDKCLDFIKSFVPESSKSFFDNTIVEIENVLKGIFYGHFLTALIIGIFGFIGYSLLGYNYGLFLGIMTGIFQLIPIFGPWPIYWALAIMDIISGNYIRAIVVIIFGLGLSCSDMYIRPALSSHYADIHPLILLIGFLAGSLAYGIVGLILGPLILGITYAILNSYKQEREKLKSDVE